MFSECHILQEDDVFDAGPEADDRSCPRRRCRYLLGGEIGDRYGV